MELIVISSDIIRIMSIMLLTYFVFTKITDYKNKNVYQILFTILCSINISLLYIILKQYFQPVSIIIGVCMLYAIILQYIVIRNEFNYLSYIISFVISYIVFLLSVLLSALILRICTSGLDFKTWISLITIPVIEIFIFNFIFRIKRVNRGFNFLKNKNTNKNITKFSSILCIVIILFFAILQNHNKRIISKGLIGILLFISIILIGWIKNQITKSYKSKMRDRTIEIQKTEIDEKSRVIEEIKAENLKLASAVHKYNKKISALEFAMKNVLKLETNTEFANEIYTILEETKEASKNFAKETEVNNNKLPLTNIPGIDNMFKYMQEEARKNDINFDLKLNTSINPLIETSISKDKFETLIGDHLKDAIIAVNASSESYKSILVTLGLVDGIYELSIHDTGIEFEIETLLKLGQEQITTHKDEGGSGIGFMTTFETLKECKASLIIEEYNPETTNYTKTVTVRFDGRNEYKIISYRAEEIKKQNNGRKIIVEKLK